MDEFNELYEKYKNPIYKYIYYLCGNKEDSEELLQETFYEAYKSIEKFRGDCRFSTFLYAIARNLYYKSLRKKKETLSLHQIGEIKHFNTPEKIYEEKEGEISLLNRINLLEDSYKDVLILRIINELSFKEIGMILGKTESYARVTFHRAKGKLGREIENERSKM